MALADLLAFAEGDHASRLALTDLLALADDDLDRELSREGVGEHASFEGLGLGLPGPRPLRIHHDRPGGGRVEAAIDPPVELLLVADACAARQGGLRALRGWQAREAQSSERSAVGRQGRRLE